MKIVILDADPAFGSAAAPSQSRGTVEISRLQRLGELTVHEGTLPEQVLERAKDADVLITNKVVLREDHFEKLPSLKLVTVLATGVNVVALDAAAARNITVCNVPGYSTASTAQHAIALLLELTNRVGLHEADVASGAWARSAAFSYFKTPLEELDGKTFGVVGFGAIGQRTASIARALGMHVLAHTRTRRDAFDVEFVEKKCLLERSDVVSLHCPLTEQTKHFIDAPALATMKKSALLINVSRGPVVDETALAAALQTRQIAGAATDVLSQEAPAADNALTNSPFCIVTPHVAWASQAARERLVHITAENIESFVQGTPQNVV